MRVFVQQPPTIQPTNPLLNLKSRNNASSQKFPAANGSGSFSHSPLTTTRETDHLQPAVSEPGDPLEREADQRASQIVQQGQPPGSAGYEDRRDAERKGQASPSQASLSGNELGAADRRFFETRFNYSFANVRVHADGEAGVAARDLHARAYTLGNHIYFAPGHYQPGTVAGDRLLAHELAHVVQQNGMRFPGAGLIQRTPDDEKTGETTQPAKQKTLDQEGVSANDPVAGKTAGIIDAVLQRNKKLAPYIGDRLKKGFKIDEKGKFIKELSDGNFEVFLPENERSKFR